MKVKDLIAVLQGFNNMNSDIKVLVRLEDPIGHIKTAIVEDNCSDTFLMDISRISLYVEDYIKDECVQNLGEVILHVKSDNFDDYDRKQAIEKFDLAYPEVKIS